MLALAFMAVCVFSELAAQEKSQLTHAARGCARVAWIFEAKDRGSFASAPLFADDRVYIAAAHLSGLSAFGRLYCLDWTTGKELRSFDDNESLKPVFSSPCLANERVYFGEGFHQDADCSLYCLNVRTWKKSWQFVTKSHTESSPVVRDGQVYFGAGEDGVYALDAATGKSRWHFDGLHVDSSPAVAEGRLYAGSGYGSRFEAFCLATANGKPIWRLPCELPVWGSPRFSGQLVFFGLGNGDLVQAADKPAGALLCLNAQTGRFMWRRSVADAVLGRAAADAARVYFGARDHHCYCLARNDGQLVWKRDMGSAVVAAPVLQDSRLYVAASGGEIWCLDAVDGTVRWTFDLGQHSHAKPQVLAAPAVVDGGRRRILVSVGLERFRF
jgi:outer membrane protein assembly factor BamB